MTLRDKITDLPNLPTFWCPKCDRWASHHVSLNDDCTRWQATTDAQLAKQKENRKLNHYGPPYQQNRNYIHNDPKKNHLHHMIATTIMINTLAMIVAAHHHNIAPSPKCAVRASLVTTTDNAHCSVTTKKILTTNTCT
jgi:transposase InsO family protein